MMYEGYSWIKVPKYKMDESKTWEERYKELESHHIAETTFLIDEIRKLASTEQAFRANDGNIRRNIILGMIVRVPQKGDIWKAKKEYFPYDPNHTIEISSNPYYYYSCNGYSNIAVKYIRRRPESTDEVAELLEEVMLRYELNG